MSEFDGHPLDALRTPLTTDAQWLKLIELVSDDDREWRIDFPAPGQTSVRMLDPDGEPIVIRPDGEVWDAKSTGLS